MNTKTVVAARAAHHVLENVHEALCDDLRVLKETISQRAPLDAIRRMQKLTGVMDQTLSIAKSNYSKIRGACSSEYVMRTMEVERKRTTREQNNVKCLSPYEEVMKCGERSVDTDIANAITPCRKQKANTTPGQESSLKKYRRGSSFDNDYVDQMMDLDDQVKRTPEEYVRMLSEVPERHKLPVAQSWSERQLIPMTARGMMKRVTHLERGNTMAAFKAWGHGPGKDRIVPLETYTNWVLSHRPGHSIGLDEVRQYLSTIRVKPVGVQTVRDYHAMSLQMSESSSGTAKPRNLETTHTADAALHRPRHPLWRRGADAAHLCRCSPHGRCDGLPLWRWRADATTRSSSASAACESLSAAVARIGSSGPARATTIECQRPWRG